MKKYILFLWVLFSSLAVFADVKITAKAPETVVVGEQIRISFTVNTSDVSDFKAPSMSQFEVLMGPSRSQQSSFQMINGKTTQSSSVTFTYILSAVKDGDYTIPSASVVVDGKTYRSNSLHIKVLPADKNANNGASSQSMRTQDAGSKITGKDLFISVTANKKKVFEQEAVLLTYKVYSLVNLSQLIGEMPDLDGFHTQEIQLPQQKSLKLENYNGRNYGTVVWRQYVLFPQRSGKLKVPEVEFEGIVIQQNRSIDPFDAFFNGGSTISEVKKKIVAPSLTIDVLPLPDRPENFSGAVGKFAMDAEISPNELKSNDALTLKVTISGEGNMKLMKQPVVDFPKDFETYDAKVTDNSKIGTGGASGNKTFEFLAVPRHAGKYTVPPVEFCYFDPDSKTYKTLKSKSFDLNVSKGREVQSAVNQESIDLINSDIRYIHQGDVALKRLDDILFLSPMYWLSYIIPFVLFIVLVILFRKYAIESANVAKMRHKKASKAASKRLRQASLLLKENNPSAFYDEVTKALWGYAGDKLNLPVSELNKENIKGKLSAKGVDDSIIDSFIDVLNECEFARYAPGDSMLTMDKIYSSATEVINKMETSIKR